MRTPGRCGDVSLLPAWADEPLGKAVGATLHPLFPEGHTAGAGLLCRAQGSRLLSSTVVQGTTG